MRKMTFKEGEHYHLTNRGNGGQIVFIDDRDRARFLFSLLYFQGDATVHHVSRYVDYFLKHNRFNMSGRILDRIVASPLVRVEAFLLLPNRFDCVVTEKTKGGVSRFMHGVLVSYTKYFNAKYRRSGHVFEGPYRALSVTDDSELCYLSAYLHKKPREDAQWRTRFGEYPWSSYQDVATENRFGKLFDPAVVRGKYADGSAYKKFADACPTRAFLKVLDESHLIED